MVPLRLVRKFQETSEVVIILGTFTAMLGDPSGRDKTRPMLESDDVLENSKAIEEQLNRFLHSGFKVIRNDKISGGLQSMDVMKLISQFNVNQLLCRDAFKKRMDAEHPIGIHELLVPIFQALDSVHVKAEIEIGGRDQLFNFQIARRLQEMNGQKPQVCLLAPILTGTDGQKMSKSLGNCVFMDDTPEDIFGKCMSVSDETMDQWISLLCDCEFSNQGMAKKKTMAHDIVRQLWGETKADEAQSFFEKTIQSGQKPDEIVQFEADDIIGFVAKIRNASRSDARRLLDAGAVTCNGEKLDLNSFLKSAMIVKVGKRHWGQLNME